LPDELVEATGDGNLPAEEPQTMTQQVLDPRHGQLAQIAQPRSTPSATRCQSSSASSSSSHRLRQNGWPPGPARIRPPEALTESTSV
jgi:hypothetical protein